MVNLSICLAIGVVLGMWQGQPFVGMFIGAVVWAIVE